jgi:hypothetical protein
MRALVKQKNMRIGSHTDARLADLFDAGFKAGLLAAARFVVIGGPIEFQINMKTTHRVYTSLGLQLRNKTDRVAPIIANRRRQLALANRPYSFRRITGRSARRRIKDLSAS